MSRASVFPDLTDALLSASTAALPDVTVTDGLAFEWNTGDYLMVGVDDPDGLKAQAGNGEQEQPTNNDRDESGDLTCAALSMNGQADQKAARNAVFGLMAAVEGLLRAGRVVVTGVKFWQLDLASFAYSQNIPDLGTSALLVFRIHYVARI